MSSFDNIVMLAVGGYIAYNIYTHFNKPNEVSKQEHQKNPNTNQITIAQAAIKAGERGMELESQKRYSEALDCYDVAIKGGVKCYVFRAGCLARLGWHLDAIDDYTKAIEIDPSDCNLYFLRSQSKHSVGDMGGLEDLKTAIFLSKNNSASSIENNQNAKLMGFSSATFLYESNLSLYPEDEIIRNMIFKKLSDGAKVKGRRPKK